MRENEWGLWIPIQWRTAPTPLAISTSQAMPHGERVDMGQWWESYKALEAEVLGAAREHLRPGHGLSLVSAPVESVSLDPCDVCGLPVGRLGEGGAHAHCAANDGQPREARVAAGRFGCLASSGGWPRRKTTDPDLLWLYWSSKPVLSILRGGRRGGVTVPMAHLTEWCRLRDAGLVRHLGGREFAPVDASITGWADRASYSQQSAKRGGQCLACRVYIEPGEPAIFRPGGYGRRSGLIHPACASEPKPVDRIAELEAELARLRGERV